MWFEIASGRFEDGGHQVLLVWKGAACKVFVCVWRTKWWVFCLWIGWVAFSNVDLSVFLGAGMNVSPLFKSDVWSLVRVELLRLMMVLLVVCCEVCLLWVMLVCRAEGDKLCVVLSGCSGVVIVLVLVPCWGRGVRLLVLPILIGVGWLDWYPGGSGQWVLWSCRSAGLSRKKERARLPSRSLPSLWSSGRDPSQSGTAVVGWLEWLSLDCDEGPCWWLGWLPSHLMAAGCWN